MTNPLNSRRAFAWSKRELRSNGGVSRAVAALGAMIVAHEVGHRAMLIHEYVQCVGLARYLLTDHDQWRELCADDPKLLAEVDAGQPSDALGLILERSYQPKNRIAKQRVSKIRIALSPLIVEGLTAVEISARIKADGGITKMAAAQAKGGSDTPDSADDNDDADAASKIKAQAKDRKNAAAEEAYEPFGIFFNQHGKAAELLKLRNCRVSMVFDFGEPDGNISLVSVVSVRKVPASL